MPTKAYDWDGKRHGRRFAKPTAQMREGNDVAGDLHVFAVGCQAVKGNGRYNMAILVRATSRDEALGKGWRIARQAYPAGEGFGDWNVFASIPDHITEPGDKLQLSWE